MSERREYLYELEDRVIQLGWEVAKLKAERDKYQEECSDWIDTVGNLQQWRDEIIVALGSGLQTQDEVLRRIKNLKVAIVLAQQRMKEQEDKVVSLLESNANKENSRLRDLLRIAIEELDDQDIPLPVTLAGARGE